MKQRNRTLSYLLIPLFLCLGLRILFLAFYRQDPSFSVLILDAYRFQERALEILDGRLMTGRPFDMVPLYPFILAAIYKLTGVSLLIVRIIQLSCGFLSGLLIYLIGKRVFDRATGITALTLYALYGVFPYFEMHLLATSLSIFVLLLFILAFLAAMGRQSGGVWALAGLAGGILVLLRPNFLPVMGCLFLFLLYFLLKSRQGRGTGRSAGHLGLFIAPLGLCLAASLLFNYMSSGERVLLTAHGGINFYIGNNPGADGTYVAVRGIGGSPVDQVSDAAALAEEALGSGLSSGQVSSYWSGRALSFMKEQPLTVIKLYVRKFAIFWNAYEVPSIADYYLGIRHFPRLCRGAVWFGLVSPLALLGMLILWKGRGFSLAFLYVLTLSYLAVLMLFYVNGRYRLPIVPVLILFAAAFIQWMVQAAVERRWPIMAAAAVVFMVLFVLVHLNLPGLDTRLFEARGAARLGTVFISNQAYDRAVSALDEAIRLDPNYYKAYLDRGVASFLQGRSSESVEDFKQALFLNGACWEAWQGLGNIALIEGRPEEAEKSYLNAMDLGGRTEELLVSLFQVYRREGKMDDGARLLEELTGRYPERSDYMLDLADIYKNTGRADEAEGLLRKLLIAHPDDPDIHFRLGVICHRQGRLDEALAHYQKAAARRPENPLYHLNLGNIFAARGDLEQAEEAFTEALRLKPDLAQARANLSEIQRRRPDP